MSLLLSNTGQGVSRFGRSRSLPDHAVVATVGCLTESLCTVAAPLEPGIRVIAGESAVREQIARNRSGNEPSGADPTLPTGSGHDACTLLPWVALAS